MSDSHGHHKRMSTEYVVAVFNLFSDMIEFADDWGATAEECAARRFVIRKIRKRREVFTHSHRRIVEMAIGSGELTHDVFDVEGDDD